MKKLEYQVSFTTPAFLGNAEQQAQWRTPPFKALLRQWWRVVKAPQVRFNVDALRSAENDLFGAASDDGEVKSHRSLVRLRLSSWSDGDCRAIEESGRVCHPEVQRGGPPCQNTPGRMIEANLYLGYGPIGVNGLARPPAIGSGKPNVFRLMVPAAHENEIRDAIQLAAWFGTLGSRSRNGWGALHIEQDHLKPLTRAYLEHLGILQPLAECLRKEWPHAVGHDGQGPLVWKTKVMGNWRAVMRELARIKIVFRTQPSLSLEGVPQGQFSPRHLLAYPVTHHLVNGAAWGGQGRLANQIRFKLAKTVDSSLEGIIVHLPCTLPRDMAATHGVNADHAVQLRTWQAVHAVLDQHATRLK